MKSIVTLRRQAVILPTYEPLAPDKNPMFLEKRVYQGSSGRVYPLPFYNRIAEVATPRSWKAVFLENEFIAVMVLPELGGRIHRATDKTNGYDFIYYQPVIKPALVGLGGPWASGGIEFNWPQHHRPSTFMPTDVAVEEEPDGSVTAWFSEHDPMARMKGMHGVRLRPGESTFELRVRVYNRTDDVQTHLWWANAAVRAHADYQSFFPPDVIAVADHAKRSMSAYPCCTGRYYGVNYAARARAPRHGTPPRLGNDLSWYENIPVPTSYMCIGSVGDFFGGYDHRAQSGLIHCADHRIAPGKKQWTWGNHPFGYAWDRNLTDPDAQGEFPPYLELMAGVYTDNQPDFSYLQPGETKSWSQWYYPFRAIGPAQAANPVAALSLRVESGSAYFGAAVTTSLPGAVVTLRTEQRQLLRCRRNLSPAQPLTAHCRLPRGIRPDQLSVSLRDASGRTLLSYHLRPAKPSSLPAPATEPPPPAEVPSNDELYVIGLHLEQYRHATRLPTPYWQEGLRRDPGDSRCNLALGRWHLRRGEWTEAETHLRASIARCTSRNDNPAEGEPFYQLGVCLRFQGRLEEAAAAFAKAAWNHAWQAAGYHALAEIDGTRGDWAAALDNINRALRLNMDNLRARALKVMALRRRGRETEASAELEVALALDPLDWWARHLQGQPLDCDNQVRLDLALDLFKLGLYREADQLLASAKDEPLSGTAPMIGYYRAACARRRGDRRSERAHLAAARSASPAYCFPARREEIGLLAEALATNPRDARAAFYLGNLFYDRRRHREALALWQRAVKLEPGNAVAWRNLGIGFFNQLRSPAKARRAYAAARRANPADARLLYESDQLEKRVGTRPARRLQLLERHPELTAQRDDLAVELCALRSQTGRSAAALAMLASRRFQPWEGGEGQALGQYVRGHLLMGQTALAAGHAGQAREHFEAASSAPENLGEAKHLLANQSDIYFWQGEAAAAAGGVKEAKALWKKAAEFTGDFQEMSVRAFSEQTYYSALGRRRLGQRTRSDALLRQLLKHGRTLAATIPAIDYFATSLPTMLLFDDDLAARQRRTGWFLQAQAKMGLGRRGEARRLLGAVLKSDPSHAAAADLIANL